MKSKDLKTAAMAAEAEAAAAESAVLPESEELETGAPETAEAGEALENVSKASGRTVWGVLYAAVTVLLIALSVTLLILDLCGAIELSEPPFFWVDLGLLIVFWADVLIRFALAKRKGAFLLANLIEIVAILPLSYLWHPLHMLHFLHLYRLLHIFHRSKELGADEILPDEDEFGLENSNAPLPEAEDEVPDMPQDRA